MRQFIGFMYALGTFIIFAFLAISCYASFKGPLGLITTAIAGAIGFFASIHTYNFAVSQGPIDAIGGTTFSSDLDNLQPGEGDDFRSLTIEELVSNFQEKKHWLKGGQLRIWDDRRGRSLDKHQIIEQITYSENEQLLKFTFKNNNQLLVWQPAKLHEAKSYLKILQAQKVEWQWQQQKRYFRYKFANKKITTQTNSNWIVKAFDLSVVHPAIIILGEFG